MRNDHRIIICPQEIAQFMKDIKSACEEMKIECDTFAFFKYHFGDEQEYFSKQLQPYFKVVDRVNDLKERGHFWAARLLQVFESFLVLLFFARSVFRYDIFIYVFDRGMFDTSHYLKKVKELEFWLLKKMNKKIIFWCVGSDTRAPYCNGSYINEDCDRIYEESIRISTQVRLTEKYGIMIDNPASAHFHTIPYINCLSIGWPIYDSNSTILEKDSEKNEKIVIIHAPSNRFVKGSERIKRIIKELSEEYPIEYIEITNTKNDDVLKKLKRADIAIDQMYSDTRCARFATEACYCGVPVVVGSNMADELNEKGVFEQPPTVVCFPEEMKNVIRELIIDEKLRDEIGKKERDFIIRQWNAKNVTKKLLEIAEGKVDDRCMVDPYLDGNIWGWGQSKDETKQQVERVVKKYGMDGLFLPKGSKIYHDYQTILGG